MAGYLHIDTNPVGSLRVRIAEPKSGLESRSMSELDYCPGDEAAVPPHCGLKGLPRCCRHWDEIELRTAGDSSTVFTTTRVQWIQERTQCKSRGCRHGWKEFMPREHFYTAFVEDYLLKVDASVTSLKFHDDRLDEDLSDYSANHIDMEGVLLGQEGQTLRRFERGQSDALPLGLWLKAGGLDLDARTDAVGKTVESFRDQGAVLRIKVHYSNKRSITMKNYLFGWLWGHRAEIQYQYSVRRLPKSGYKVSEKVNRSGGGSSTGGKDRTIRKRHGIHIIFNQVGEIGRFSWSSLGMYFIAGLAILSSLPMLVDCVWAYGNTIGLKCLSGKDYTEEVWRKVRKS